MYDIICVTNRKLCIDDFAKRIKTIAETNVSGIILREKDLTPLQYDNLAADIIKSAGSKLVIHSFEQTATDLNCRNIHLPMNLLRKTNNKSYFNIIGASCHSVDDAKEAEELGCTYITAGHIFDTQCKKGLPGRGLEFLSEICKSVSIPVYAIGGINKDNTTSVINAGARGICIMSGLMTCNDPKEYISQLRSTVK